MHPKVKGYRENCTAQPGECAGDSNNRRASPIVEIANDLIELARNKAF